MSKYTWRSAGLTHRGKVRGDNQDNYHISSDGRLFVVADGVGGSYGGAMASRIAVETAEELWKSAGELTADKIEAWIRDTVNQANERIAKAAEEKEHLHNMGTTIVIVVVDESGVLHIGHVGDSRASLISSGENTTLTMDHSVVMEMHLRGQLTLEQCRTNPYRHLITRCLGHDEAVEVDYKTSPVQHGEWIVMATDGLADVILEEEIASMVNGCEDPQSACEKLLNEVLERGAPDNTTIIVVAFTEVAKPAMIPVESGSN